MRQQQYQPQYQSGRDQFKPAPVQMRQLTRDDVRGPLPVMVTPQELAMYERQHLENQRREKLGQKQSQEQTRQGKSVIAGMCCVAGFELAQIVIIIVFMVKHEDFCGQYWKRSVDGVYTAGDGDKFWPVLNGQAKTYLWTWVYLLTLSINAIINLAALTSHGVCSASLDNTCHAFMQYSVTILHFFTGLFAFAWIILGAVWTFGNKVIPWECKQGDLGENEFYVFLAVIVILGLVSWPLFCMILAIKSSVWWHDPAEGDRMLSDHWNNVPKPVKPDKDVDFEQLGYMA